ncbi:MAG: hypothetical protein KGH63_04950 [Candidatus Micrarchaeota archaeon]|nr:hypothetical protein [Candidatus Micrarchaeota archaeon]
MVIHFWRDETADALQKSDSTAALFWKLSNAFGRVSLVLIAAAVWLAMAAYLTEKPALAEAVANPWGIFGMALLCWLASSLFITAYSISLAVVAYRFRDYAWMVGNVAFWPVAVVYAYIKGAEIRRGLARK